MTEPERWPDVPGNYFATSRRYGWRRCVLVEQNGHKQTRVFVARMTCSFGIEEFRDWSERLVDTKLLETTASGQKGSGPDPKESDSGDPDAVRL